jgi:hypothetical protein
MGAGELMASVVSGMDKRLLGALLPALADLAGAAACGAAAVTMCRLLNTVSARAKAAARRIIFHRISMKTSPGKSAALNHTPAVRAPSSEEEQYDSACEPVPHGLCERKMEPEYNAGDDRPSAAPILC